MAINKRNKRRVLLDGQEYLWWVFDEIDQTEFDGIQTKIVSSSQTHFFKYGLQQTHSERKVVFAWSNYTQLVHLACPKFENKDGIITKSGILNLIQWCQHKGHEILYAVDRQNNKLSEQEQQLLLKKLRNDAFLKNY